MLWLFLHLKVETNDEFGLGCMSSTSQASCIHGSVSLFSCRSRQPQISLEDRCVGNIDAVCSFKCPISASKIFLFVRTTKQWSRWSSGKKPDNETRLQNSHSCSWFVFSIELIWIPNQIKYIDTKKQAADTLTKGNFILESSFVFFKHMKMWPKKESKQKKWCATINCNRRFGLKPVMRVNYFWAHDSSSISWRWDLFWWRSLIKLECWQELVFFRKSESMGETNCIRTTPWTWLTTIRWTLRPKQNQKCRLNWTNPQNEQHKTTTSCKRLLEGKRNTQKMFAPSKIESNTSRDPFANQWVQRQQLSPTSIASRRLILVTQESVTGQALSDACRRRAHSEDVVLSCRRLSIMDATRGGTVGLTPKRQRKSLSGCGLQTEGRSGGGAQGPWEHTQPHTTTPTITHQTHTQKHTNTDWETHTHQCHFFFPNLFFFLSPRCLLPCPVAGLRQNHLEINCCKTGIFVSSSIDTQWTIPRYRSTTVFSTSSKSWRNAKPFFENAEPQRRSAKYLGHRTMLDEQRRTIVAEYGEKVLHHELLAAQAEQDRKILQEELLRQQQYFREVSSTRSYEDEGIAKIPEFYLQWAHQTEVHRGSEHYYGIIWKTSRTAEIQDLQNEVVCMNDSKDFQDAESVPSGNSHVTSPPGLFPGHPPFEGLLKPAFISPRRTDGPPKIWDTSGKSGNVSAHPQASSSAPYPQELNSTWKKTIEEPIHMSTAEKSGRPKRDSDLRCQSGPSAKDLVIFSGGDSSKNYGADQQRLQISDLHFDKFPTSCLWPKCVERLKHNRLPINVDTDHAKPAWRNSPITSWAKGTSLSAPPPCLSSRTCASTGNCTTQEGSPPHPPRLLNSFLQDRWLWPGLHSGQQGQETVWSPLTNTPQCRPRERPTEPCDVVPQARDLFSPSGDVPPAAHAIFHALGCGEPSHATEKPTWCRLPAELPEEGQSVHQDLHAPLIRWIWSS